MFDDFSTFSQVDEHQRGRLTCIETMVALRAMNHGLSEAEEEYIYRVGQLFIHL